MILQDLLDNEQRKASDPNWKPYTTKEWNEVKRKQANIARIAKSPKDSDAWFELIDKYYTDVLPLVKNRVEAEFNREEEFLKPDILAAICNRTMVFRMPIIHPDC